MVCWEEHRILNQRYQSWKEHLSLNNLTALYKLLNSLSRGLLIGIMDRIAPPQQKHNSCVVNLPPYFHSPLVPLKFMTYSSKETDSFI